jgi:hypothetical protein
VQKCMELDKALNLIDTAVNTEANYGIFNWRISWRDLCYSTVSSSVCDNFSAK